MADVAAVAQHQDAGAIDVEQRGDLGQHAFGQPLHRLEVVQRRGGVDDDFEPAPGLHHALELLIAAQRRGQRGEQLVGGQLGLGLVVVDVVVDDHPPLRRLAGLAGAQDDAHGLVAQLVADEFDQIEAGGVGLHDDVEQHRGDVGMRPHQLAALRRRIGRQDLQRLAVQAVVAEREAGALVDREVVVDHRDLPPPRVGFLQRDGGVFDQLEDIVLVGHGAFPSLAGGRLAYRLASCGARHDNAKCCTLSRAGFQHHPAAELLGDQIVDDMQAEPGAAVVAPRGEERVERLALHVRRHPGAVVGEHDLDVVVAARPGA